MTKLPRLLLSVLTALASYALVAASPAGAAGAVPSAPAGVHATYTPGTNNAVISWDAVTANPAVLVYTASTAGASCTSLSTSCVVAGLVTGQTYTFKVTATNANGTGPASLASNAVTIVFAHAPSAPTGVAASFIPNTTTAQVTWTAPANAYPSVSSYTATASPGGAHCTVTTTTCQIGGFSAGVSYVFTVTATNANGTSPASSASNTINTLTPPPAPTQLQASPLAAGDTAVTLTWVAPVNSSAPVTGYNVMLGTTSVCATVATTCTITGLTPNTSYVFTVTATSAHGTGPASAPTAPIVPWIDLASAPSNLAPGQFVYSANKAFYFGIVNGNLVVARTATNQVTWSARLRGATMLVLQPNTGELYVQAGSRVIWYTNTHFATPGRLIVTNTGVAAWYNGSKVTWRS